MEREAVYVKTPSKTIENMKNFFSRSAEKLREYKTNKIEEIKDKYDNRDMSDETALKICVLEIQNEKLKRAAIAMEIATAIDIACPDPLPAADEALLAGLTALFKGGAVFVDNIIHSMAEKGTPDIDLKEVTKLARIIFDIKKKSNPENNLQEDMVPIQR